MSFLMPSCKEATILAAQREVGSLSFIESLRLRFHLAICGVCKAFEHQVAVLSKSAKTCECGKEMSAECEQRLSECLREEMSKQ